MSEREIEKTTVGIVGGGPAGLMLAHLLSKAGIDTIAIDDRTRDLIETTHRAGILEAQAVRMLLDEGVSDRILRDGFEHEGIFLRFNGESHRIDFKKLVNESVWLYPQQDVFIDLADARARDGGKVYFGISGTEASRASKGITRSLGSPTPTAWIVKSSARSSSGRTARARSAATSCRRPSATSSSASTRSRGSASSARRRSAPPNSSTATPSAASP